MPADILSFALKGLAGYRGRSGLMLLAMAIGVAAVVLLTALGEGARRYVTGEFASLGTHLLIVLPGRSETTGGPPPLMGETPRDLTLDDAEWIRVEQYYCGRLLAYALRRTGDLQTSEDILQETLMGAVRGIGDFDPAFTFEQYLFGICRNRTVDYLSKVQASTLIEELLGK